MPGDPARAPRRDRPRRRRRARPTRRRRRAARDRRRRGRAPLERGDAPAAPRPRAWRTRCSPTRTTPYAEVARATGIPVGSLGPTRARVLRQLRQLLVDGRPRPADAARGAESQRAARVRPAEQRRRLHPAVHAELVVDPADVHADGLLADEQPPGDLAVGQPGGEHLEHLQLAAGQRLQRVRGRAGAPAARRRRGSGGPAVGPCSSTRAWRPARGSRRAAGRRPSRGRPPRPGAAPRPRPPSAPARRRRPRPGAAARTSRGRAAGSASQRRATSAQTSGAGGPSTRESSAAHIATKVSTTSRTAGHATPRRRAPAAPRAGAAARPPRRPRRASRAGRARPAARAPCQTSGATTQTSSLPRSTTSSPAPTCSSARSGRSPPHLQPGAQGQQRDPVARAGGAGGEHARRPRGRPPRRRGGPGSCRPCTGQPQLHRLDPGRLRAPTPRRSPRRPRPSGRAGTARSRPTESRPTPADAGQPQRPDPRQALAGDGDPALHLVQRPGQQLGEVEVGPGDVLRGRRPAPPPPPPRPAPPSPAAVSSR